MAQRKDELTKLADVVAISVDAPIDVQKANQLLGGAFPLLSDPELRVISAYQMRHAMGGLTVGNMGYVIIDGRGVVREVVVDPVFGWHADAILQSLKSL
ncbi:MAG: redoxin domain-containing protein [Chloroflexi bacterium]|nr:redoxin domain-containing protein [Chloroflexota bacterium]